MQYIPKACHSFIFDNNGKVIMVNPEPDPGIIIHGMKGLKKKADKYKK